MSTQESDGIDEALQGVTYVAMTAAARMGEQLARMREQQARDALARSEQAVREQAERMAAEREAARASLEAEDMVVQRTAALFADLDARVEIRNEARVHLWYGQHFGVPARPFTSPRDAIDHFASTTCCYALTRDAGGVVEVYAPRGYDDLFDQRVRPNPVLAPRQVYETKTARWQQQWARLVIDPRPESVDGSAQ